MANYAIGDVQGCYASLLALLEHIEFDPALDVLWFTGDLVNRGSDSLAVLRFVKQLGAQQRTVLGNHDLHLLAVASNPQQALPADTLHEILKAPDCAELLAWLQAQPLLYHDANLNFVMVHAGLAPSWDLATAKRLAAEVQAMLHSPQATEFLKHMYGDLPTAWNEELQGWDRLRCITNYFTRLRYCYADGGLELEENGTLLTKPADLIPWFDVPQRVNKDLKILFGHWAALGGVTNRPHVYALDTGCVWGYRLTALRLEDEKYFSVESQG